MCVCVSVRVRMCICMLRCICDWRVSCFILTFDDTISTAVRTDTLNASKKLGTILREVVADKRHAVGGLRRRRRKSAGPAKLVVFVLVFAFLGHRGVQLSRSMVEKERRTNRGNELCSSHSYAQRKGYDNVYPYSSVICPRQKSIIY